MEPVVKIPLTFALQQTLTFVIVIGAIYSVISLLACVAPTMTFQLYGIIPIPAWLAVTGLFSYDLYSTLSNKVRRVCN
jgi:hypothetical protein